MTNTVHNLTIKSVDGVLGTRTQGGRMVGVDESTELWRHPGIKLLLSHIIILLKNDVVERWALGSPTSVI